MCPKWVPDTLSALATALPQGVTLEAPVVADTQYGESSKTVEDALASLQAYVRDNQIVDGGLGREVWFQSSSSKPAKDQERSTKKVKMPYLVVILKWAGASGAAPAWTGVTAFMVTKKAERRIFARPGRTPGKDYD